mgnify:CR=1 FL=1
MNQTPPTDIYNQTVFETMPKGLKKIIEIGTGSGALANAYKKENPNTNYIGVEIDGSYADLSSRYCEKVYLENFEKPSIDLLDELKDSDLVIFSDVLEHMYNPWKVLDTLSELLPPYSSVIASIPNTQHWSFQKSLLAGNLTYTDSGLLDRTHIRFFTRKTMQELFTKNGFSIATITPRIFDFPNQNEHLEWIKSSAIAFNLDAEEAILDAATFQFVINANRT